jgi:hypothetical protein
VATRDSVVSFEWYDASHTAARIRNVALVAGYHMYVRVPYRLPACFAAVDSNIKTVGREACRKQWLHVSYKTKAEIIFIGKEVPNGNDVPAGKNERVTGRDGEAIQHRDRGFVLGQDFSARVAKNAAGHRLRHDRMIVQEMGALA